MFFFRENLVCRGVTAEGSMLRDGVLLAAEKGELRETQLGGDEDLGEGLVLERRGRLSLTPEGRNWV